MYFMHERGYTFFDMNKLTLPEYHILVKEATRQAKEREKEAKKAQRKKKWR